MKSIKRKLKRGFTLVELVVTIAIIAILSGASVATYFGITENARSTSAENTATQIASVLRVEATFSEGDLSIGEDDEGISYLAVSPDVAEDYDISVIREILDRQGIAIEDQEELLEIPLSGATNSETDSKVYYLHYKNGRYNWYIDCTHNFSISLTGPALN